MFLCVNCYRLFVFTCFIHTQHLYMHGKGVVYSIPASLENACISQLLRQQAWLPFPCTVLY